MQTRRIKKIFFSTLLAVITLVSLGGCVVVHRDHDDFEHHHLHGFYWGHD